MLPLAKVGLQVACSFCHAVSNASNTDAIDGLRELISEYATLGLQNLTIIITRCVRVIGDEVSRLF